jgi:hypothetical protein
VRPYVDRHYLRGPKPVGAAVVLAGACGLVCGTAAATAAANANVVSPAATVLSTCSYAALQRAVAHGGLVDLACSGAVNFPGPIIINAGQSVYLDGSGTKVTLNGEGAFELFVVKGGSLTLVDLALSGAMATGNNGHSGLSGGNGADGSNGARARRA